MDKKTAFWNSFLLGFLLGAIGLYFFGTQKGRKKLKEILEILEEEDKIIDFLEETTKKLNQKSPISLNKILQKLDLEAKL